MDLGYWTQVVRFGNKCLYPLSCLATLSNSLLIRKHRCLMYYIETHKQKICGNRGRDWSDTSARKECQQLPDAWQRQRRALPQSFGMEYGPPPWFQPPRLQNSKNKHLLASAITFVAIYYCCHRQLAHHLLGGGGAKEVCGRLQRKSVDRLALSFIISIVSMK